MINLPKKKRIESKNKKKYYKYRTGTTIVLYFPNESSYQQNFKSVRDGAMASFAIEKASNVVVWIAKQGRFRVIKGYVTNYQLDLIEVDIENVYNRPNHKMLIALNNYIMFDYSHLPPEANYVND